MLKLAILAATLLVASAHRVTHARDVGVISNFVVKSSTADSVTLSWELTESEYDLMKCTVTRDDFWNSDVLCTSSVCEHTEHGLDSCNEYSFSVVCFYNADGSPTQTNKETTSATTAGSAPGNIANIQHTGTVLTWDKDQCSSEYIVCYYNHKSTEDQICQTTTEVTFDLGVLELCSVYEVTINGKSSNGMEGTATHYQIQTEEGVPGPVLNVEAISSGETSILVSFDEPLENPYCANGFSVAVGIVTETLLKRELKAGIRHNITVDGLQPCTNYAIDVFAVTADVQLSPPVRVFASTTESAPGPPGSIEITPNDDGTITVTWVTDPDEKCAGDMEICFILNGIEIVEDCLYTGDNDTIEYGPLEKCKSYQMILVPESPSGIIGDPTVVNVDPIDAMPGPVTNYEVTTFNSTTIQLSFDDPTENPDCVAGYLQAAINLNQTSYRDEAIFRRKHESFHDLEPCCTYEIKTQATSLTGMIGPVVTDYSTLSEELPSAPRKLEILSAQSSPTTLYLKWWQPLSYQFCVVSYVVRTAGIEEAVDTDGSTFEVRYVLQHLDPCTDYTIDVVGITPSGAETDAVTVFGTTDGC